MKRPSSLCCTAARRAQLAMTMVPAGRNWRTRMASPCFFPSSSAATTPISASTGFFRRYTAQLRRSAFDPPDDRSVVIAHGLDRSRIFVTGLSAGGAMASVMLATYPEVFAGGAIIAGLPYGVAQIPEAFDRMRGHGGPSERECRILSAAPPHRGRGRRFLFGTARRSTVVSSNADAIVDQWRGVPSWPIVRPVRNGGRAFQAGLARCGGPRGDRRDSIAGMGHGTPLETGGDVGLGAGAPFMLDSAFPQRGLSLGSGALRSRARRESRQLSRQD